MSSHTFLEPVKRIHNNHDFETFVRSSAYKDILDFVKDCAEAVVDKPNSFADTHTDTDARRSHGRAVVQRFVDFMAELHALVDAVPPLQQPMRFGNKAFRDWHARLVERAPLFLRDLLAFHVDFLATHTHSGAVETNTQTASDNDHTINDNTENNDNNTIILCAENIDSAAAELAHYLFDMFGNATRIDYGTGHELNFAILFLLLKKLGVVQGEDLPLVVTQAFPAYVRTMRKLQTVYMLEPAGSHGVWGLDDYHCLLFLWGAAQLSRQSGNDVEITPSAIHDAEVVREFASEYIYLEGIAFIRHIKHGAPFAETSPMLNDISGMHHWAKICSGLMKLFQGEVLNKFPVIQHIRFGSLLELKK